MDLEPLETIYYEKTSGAVIVQCSIEVFNDSAYVSGSEIDMVFEFSASFVADAMRYVESLGYLRRETLK